MGLFRRTIEENRLRCPYICKFLSVLTCVISLIFMFMVTGCGPVPSSELNIPETTTPTVGESPQLQSKNSVVKLPVSAIVDLQKQPYLRKTFNTPNQR